MQKPPADHQLIEKHKLFLKPNRIANMNPMRYGDMSKLQDLSVDEDGYTHTKTITERVFYEDSQFKYKLNSDNFRSQHFKKLKEEDINILYSGCSFTYGVGQPEQYTWPALLTEKIKEKFNTEKVESFNVAYPGASIHEIIRNCFAFFENFGNPDYVFLLVPDVNRSICFIESEDEYKAINPSGQNLDRSLPKELIHEMESYSGENRWLIAADLMSMLEAYCNSNNIKLVWTTWINHQEDPWKILNFKNYFFPKLNAPKLWYHPKDNEKPPFPVTLSEPNDLGLPYWEFARDGRHPGTCWTTNEAKKFFNALNNRYPNEQN